MKVRRIKDAFDRPFRNRATSAVFSVGSQVSWRTDDAVVSASAGEKIPDVAGSAVSSSRAVSVLDSAPAQRGVKGRANQSPQWGLDSPPTASSGLASRPPREPSPVWDIELDLNEDDLYADVDPRLAAKKVLGSDE